MYLYFDEKFGRMYTQYILIAEIDGRHHVFTHSSNVRPKIKKELVSEADIDQGRLWAIMKPISQDLHPK